MTALSVLLVAAIVTGWLGLVALWWLGFRGAARMTDARTTEARRSVTVDGNSLML